MRDRTDPHCHEGLRPEKLHKVESHNLSLEISAMEFHVRAKVKIAEWPVMGVAVYAHEESLKRA